MTRRLDTCGCFPTAPGPAQRPDNLPGLDRVAYRVAAYPESLARMLAGLPGPAAESTLARLTTREADDPAVALLDAAAVVADVLAFYSERIANEGFLRTATERLSVLELAREIGYELGPGLAAETFLSFHVEDRAVQPGKPAESLVPKGTRVQSLPTGGGMPQTFETADAFVARAAWNELHPVMSEPQALDDEVQTIYLAGTATAVREGDVLLLALPGSTGEVATQPKAHLAHRVVVEGDLDRTRVELAPAARPATPRQRPTFLPGKVGVHTTTLTGATAESAFGGSAWSEESFTTMLGVNEWEPAFILAYFNPMPAPPPDLGPAAPGVFTFRTRAAVFGHNAPNWHQLPTSMTTDGPYPDPWDDDATGVDVTTDSQGTGLGATTVRLDTTYRVVPDSWVLLTSGTPDQGKPYRIAEAVDRSLADFAISARVTQLALKTFSGGDPGDLDAFKPRDTSVALGSERLELAEVSLPPTIDAGVTHLDLDRLVLDLAPGQCVAVTGDRDDLAGVRATEIVTLSAIEHAGGRTTLTFSALQHPYVRRSVVLNANVVRASHGETVPREVLGSGSGLADQRFRLRRPPVTHRTAATGTGAASALEVRVDGVRWDEAGSFVDAGPRDELYLTRRADDGRTTIIFGDGVNGARPPTGAENVTADYRTGIGAAGLVGAGAISLLAVRPPGITDVTNPMATEGAEDPETRDAARANAPLTVTTLGRIVSLSDYEDFARAFSGVGKARATELWRGERRATHVTVAGPAGATIPSKTIDNLVKALDDLRDPGIPVEIEGFGRIYVRLAVDILIDRRLEAAPTIQRVRTALAAAFGFERRAFGEALTAAQVIDVVLGVPGIVDTAILSLYPVTDGIGAPSVLRQDPILARLARWAGGSDDIAPAELILLEPAGATVTERAS